jgi:regulation of enolase protein 1 (concanavalin A-like superfamily)
MTGLDWTATPAGWAWQDGALTAVAGPRTDLFVDPADGTRYDNAARLLARSGGDFQFSARVRVGFAETYDAGVLLLWVDQRSWAKLCFERSPQGQPMAVSVVNRGVSDDANGFPVDGDALWLRISRLGTAFAFHASTDGRFWHLVRYFALDVAAGEPVAVGFEAQSPLGAGCAVEFTDVRFVPDRLVELRDGS